MMDIDEMNKEYNGRIGVGLRAERRRKKEESQDPGKKNEKVIISANFDLGAYNSRLLKV